MFAHRRTGERAENAMMENVRGGAEECINVVKYNETVKRGREMWRRRCDVSASRGNAVMGAGMLSSSIFVAGARACSSTATLTRDNFQFFINAYTPNSPNLAELNSIGILWISIPLMIGLSK